MTHVVICSRWGEFTAEQARTDYQCLFFNFKTLIAGEKRWDMVPEYYEKFSRQTNPGTSQSGTFKDLDATELYCPRCKMAVPVRKRLLLVLPEGDKYEYICAYCAESVGSKIDRHQKTSLIM